MIKRDNEQVNSRLREQYLGEKQKELREGFGVYVYENKFFRYEGEWRNGKKHGHGKLIMADGSYYEGQFQNGEIRGHGFRYWSTSGNKYAGQVEKGELHGRGMMEYKDGSVYEGEWCRNVRQGRGKLTDKLGQVYEGEFHKHKRHGEGRQTFANGDVYDGHWICDQRQGHGYLAQADGSTYEGQWLRDVFSGHGRMLHCSGILYEGPWLYGRPTSVAARLDVSNGPTLQCCQGVPFEVVAEVRTAEGDLLSLESGRELRVSAWFRARPPAAPPAENGAAAGAGGPLLDLIEDTEERTLTLPFGYDAVPFPLTDEVPSRDFPGLSTDPSAITEAEEDDGGEGEPTPLPEPSPVPASEDTAKEEEKAEPAAEEVSESPAAQPGDVGPEEAIEREETSVSVDPAQEDVPPAAPVPNVRTDDGCAVWETLLLPQAPALYRPFALLDEQAGIVTPASKDAKGRMKDKRRLTSKEKEKLEEHEICTTPTKPRRPIKGTTSDHNTTLLKEDAKAKYKRLGNPNFARPGEYIIMVEDVSEPAFFETRLEPAYLKVDLQAPRRERRSTSKKVEEKKKHWVTAEVIARTMARASVQLSDKDVERFRQKRGSVAF